MASAGPGQLTEPKELAGLAAVLRRVSEEVDSRLGGRALTEALEEHRRQRNCQHQQYQQREFQGQEREAARGGAGGDGGDVEGRGEGGDVVAPFQATKPPPNLYRRQHPAHTVGETAGAGRMRWAGVAELERSRRAHRAKLEELLSGCVGSLPFEPIGGGW